MTPDPLEKLAKKLIRSALCKPCHASIAVASQQEADRLFVKIHRAAVKRDIHCSDIKLRGIPFLLLLCKKLRQKAEPSKILIYWPFRLTGEMPSASWGWQAVERYHERVQRGVAEAAKLRKEKP